MPATSIQQARFFRWASHNPEEAKREGKYPAGMSQNAMHDYASTKDAGLPKRAHLEDGQSPRYFKYPPKQMEDGGTNWIGAATAAPGFRKGALTAKAHAAGESPMTFAREHASSPGRTGQQARFAINAQKR